MSNDAHVREVYDSFFFGQSQQFEKTSHQGESSPAPVYPNPQPSGLLELFPHLEKKEKMRLEEEVKGVFGDMGEAFPLATQPTLSSSSTRCE
eukprot:gene4770-3431_t